MIRSNSNFKLSLFKVLATVSASIAICCLVVFAVLSYFDAKPNAVLPICSAVLGMFFCGFKLIIESMTGKTQNIPESQVEIKFGFQLKYDKKK